MTNKKFFFSTIAFSLGLLVLIALMVYVIDPFVHYHAPYFGLAVTETDERGQQIGVAKNCDYDTAIIGTSMSENFCASWFNDGIIGEKTVKLSMQGAHFDDFNLLLDAALNKKQGTKTIIFSLDNYILLNVPQDYPTTIPEYLSNDTPTDDLNYLWNKSVVLYHVPIFLLNNFKYDFSSDEAYVWADRYEFDEYVAKGSYLPYRVMVPEEEENYDTYYKYAYEFLDACGAYVRSHPDVEFIFYVPPYSIMYWDDVTRRGRLTAEVAIQQEVIGTLLWIPNVRVFYFQNDWDIITNLDNYKDYSHYSQDINRYIYECMRDGKKEITKDNFGEVTEKFKEDIRNYDFESIFH